MEGALYQQQRVGGGGDGAERADHGKDRMHLIGAEQDQEFADEIAEPRQAERGDGEEHAPAGEARQAGPEPAKLGEIARVQPLLQGAGEDEQRAGADAVGQHLHHHALQRQRVPGIDAEQDEAEMADAAIGDQPLQIRLPKSQQRAINDGDDAEQHGDGRERHRRLREQRHREAQQPVGPGLQQHAREDDAAGGRRLGMRVGQPGMERHGGEFHGKGDEEAEHDPEFRGPAICVPSSAK